MNIIVNGVNKEINVSTLTELVTEFKLDENLVVTEVDGVIIDKEARGTTNLKDGMVIEIVQFVGGG